MLKVITTKAEAPTGEAPTIGATLDDLARDGARRMIAAALQLEVEAYVTRFRAARDEAGHALVVRNGTARPRPVTTGVGPLTITAPRVNDRRVMAGVRQKFTSAILAGHRGLICDRDCKWTERFRGLLEAAAVHIVLTPVQAPNANAHAERFVRSIREECLDRLILFGERDLIRAVDELCGALPQRAEPSGAR